MFNYKRVGGERIDRFIDWLREVAMMECAIRGTFHAHNIDHEERWKANHFWFVGEAVKCLFWMAVCDCLLFVANGILANIFPLKHIEKEG